MSTKAFFIKLENPQDPSITTIPGDWKSLAKKGYWGKHPQYGEIEFTSQTLDSFYNNFKQQTVGKELSFNFNHDNKSKAALWLKDLRKVLNSQGETVALEYLPEYTPEGFKLISGKEYQYVSLEYADDYNKHGPTLLGGACTNDPFIVGEGLTKLEADTIKSLDEIYKELKGIETNLKAHPELYRKTGSPQARSLFNMALKNIAKYITQKEEENIMPTELEKISQELQALKDNVKKLETDNQKLQTDKKELEKGQVITQNEEIKKLQTELTKTKLEAWRTKMLSKGHMGEAITMVEKEVTDNGSFTIKLENKSSFDILSYSEKLMESSCPEKLRVNLSQEPNSGTWVKLETGKDNKENPLVANAKARVKEGK